MTNRIREYRKRYGLTQAEAVEKFKPIVPEMDVPLLSKMERGVCMPSYDLSLFLDEALANPFKELDLDKGIVLPSPLKDLLKSPIFSLIYEELQKGTKDKPITKARLMVLTGLNERTIRDHIEKLRLAGVRVISLSSVRGYWIAESGQDVYYHTMKYEMLCRATAMYRLVTAMDGQLSGQIGMDELNE